MKRWRNLLFLFFIFILAATILGRLFYLQIFQHKFYEAQALGQQAGFKEVQGARGAIFFQNSKEGRGSYASGQPKSLAINEDTWLVSAVPKKIQDKTVTADSLSKILDETPESLMAKLEKSASYAILKKELSAEEVKQIKELALDGLSLESSPARYYPQEIMASQVVGFLGGGLTGQYGIEGYYEDLLTGKKGIKEEKKGFNIIDSTSVGNLNGSDLYLTIDYNIQFQAEDLLRQEKIKNNIDSGQIIVIKPDSGRIVVMANFPSFDLNNYSKEHLEIFQNSTVQKLFEPGSVFKPFTMAMALEENKINPDSIFVDTGSVTIGPDTIFNFDHEKYGSQKMSGILEKSINTGAVWLSQLISHQTFSEYVSKLGIDEKTEIDVQGEVRSENTLLKTGSNFGFATASFGQGIEMTPIQLVRAFSVFANAGKMSKPFLVEKIVKGVDEQITRSEVSGQIISEQTASEVNPMLINVVDRGYGNGAKIPGYYLAGKTGTAQVPFENKKGYYPDRTIQSFIGFGPALKPQFLILVKLDNPKVPKSALSAVPIFKKLAQYIINYWQIPPDYQIAP